MWFFLQNVPNLLRIVNQFNQSNSVHSFMNTTVSHWLLIVGHTECVCDEQEGFVFWNETQNCYRVYTQGPCPDNAWLIPADDLTEVFCECKAGYHFSPSQYVCRRSPLVKPLGNVNPGLHLLLKNHKMYGTRMPDSNQDYDQVCHHNAYYAQWISWQIFHHDF